MFAGNEDAQVIRFQSGDSDLLARTTADNFSLLSRDEAAGLEAPPTLGRRTLREAGPR